MVILAAWGSLTWMGRRMICTGSNMVPHLFLLKTLGTCSNQTVSYNNVAANWGPSMILDLNKITKTYFVKNKKCPNSIWNNHFTKILEVPIKDATQCSRILIKIYWVWTTRNSYRSPVVFNLIPNYQYNKIILITSLTWLSRLVSYFKTWLKLGITSNQIKQKIKKTIILGKTIAGPSCHFKCRKRYFRKSPTAIQAFSEGPQMQISQEPLATSHTKMKSTRATKRRTKTSKWTSRPNPPTRSSSPTLPAWSTSASPPKSS